MRLEIQNGTFSYPSSDRRILRDIQLSLTTGEILAILGPNGAGKTTLLRCAAGLLAWDSGKTLLDGRDLRRIPRRTLWQQISYVPQTGQAAAAYTVEEMVLLGCASMLSPFAIPGRREADAVSGALERTGLKELRHHSCARLSGGELRMVLIARAIVSDPAILILDEPEANLDLHNQLLVLNMISELSREGRICVFNTHDPAHALRMADKAMMLSREGESCFGDAKEVITEENLRHYFGVRSVIGSVITEDAEYPDVVPIAICDNQKRPGSRFEDPNKKEEAV